MPIDAGIGPCLNWVGAKHKFGYGAFRWEGHVVTAHRVAYADYNGVPMERLAGVVVRHKCDNPCCFNPSHLEAGTQADNMRDMKRRGRLKTSPKAGEMNPAAKLTSESVATIRKSYVKGSAQYGCYGLARLFGVGPAVIHRIVKGTSWKGVQGDSNAD